METKADIRKHFLTIRKGLTLKEQEEKSWMIQEKVLQHEQFCRAEWIFLYMDYKAEVQTGHLLKEALNRGKYVALPRVEEGSMDFYAIQSVKEIRPGYCGILEPVSVQKVLKNQGFMAVPGAAFSIDGFRLGYGRGFYDRYLKRFPGIYTCGLAYSCQLTDHLPIEEHDIRLNEILSE